MLGGKIHLIATYFIVILYPEPTQICPDLDPEPTQICPDLGPKLWVTLDSITEMKSLMVSGDVLVDGVHGRRGGADCPPRLHGYRARE